LIISILLIVIKNSCVLQVTPLIELFGNASTVLNKNSSRFGKLVEIFYGNDGNLIGGKITILMIK